MDFDRFQIYMCNNFIEWKKMQYCYNMTFPESVCISI